MKEEIDERERLVVATKLANEEYSKVIKEYTVAEREYMRLRVERLYKMIDQDIALIKLKMFDGCRYVVKIGKCNYDVVNVSREGAKYKIDYLGKNNIVNTVMRQTGPWLLPDIKKQQATS